MGEGYAVKKRSRLKWIFWAAALMILLAVSMVMCRQTQYQHPLKMKTDLISGICIDISKEPSEAEWMPVPRTQLRAFCALWNELWFARIEPYRDRAGFLTAADMETEYAIRITYTDDSEVCFSIGDLYIEKAEKSGTFGLQGEIYVYGTNAETGLLTDFLDCLIRQYNGNQEDSPAEGKRRGNVCSVSAGPATVRNLSAYFKADEIDRIEHIRWGQRKTEFPDIRQPEQINQICTVYSTLRAQALPEQFIFQSHYAGVSTTGPVRETFVFRYCDGRTLEVDNPFSMLMRIDGRWFYVSCGERYGYAPVAAVLQEIRNWQNQHRLN